MKKFKYIICRRMIDDSWEVNEFYLEKGISAKEAIEESASLLFASLFPQTITRAPSEPSINEMDEGGRRPPEESDLQPPRNCICSILFYDRSDKGTGFLPINFAYIDPEDPEGMLMEGCRSKYTDRFFKKLTDDILSKILAKEAACELPSKQRKRIGLNCILKGNADE